LISAAVRDAVAEFTWRDASTTARDKLAQRIEHRFCELLETDLAAVALTNCLQNLPKAFRRLKFA